VSLIGAAEVDNASEMLLTVVAVAAVAETDEVTALLAGELYDSKLVVVFHTASSTKCELG